MVNFQKADGAWHYPLISPIAIEMPPSSEETAIALGVVLKSDSAEFKNASDQLYYNRVMYFVYQPLALVNTTAGFGCVAFSNDGLDWSAPKLRVVEGDPSQVIACDSADESTQKFEMISGIKDAATMYMVGVEGDIPTIIQYANADRSLTYLYLTGPSSPHALTYQGELPTAGLFNPNIPNGTQDRFFRNLDVTYDPTTDKVLMLRATPFPYLFEDVTYPYLGVPCSGECPAGLPTFPMRGQVYSQIVNGDPLSILTGTWQLELDIGGLHGWKEQETSGSCTVWPANDPLQQDIGFDLDSLNILKSANGFVDKESNGSMTLYMGAFQDRQNLCDSVPFGESASWTFQFGGLRSLPFQTEPIVGEIGRVNNLGMVAFGRTVQLSRSYENPVVFARPLSDNERQGAVVRITSVSSTQFTMKAHYPPTTPLLRVAKPPTNDMVSYIVLEAGRWQTDEGAIIEVGKTQTTAEIGHGVINSFEIIEFQQPFSLVPSVLTQVQSNNNPNWVMTRQRNSTSTGFDMAMQEADSMGGHGQETVGWMAISPHQGTWSGRMLHSGSTSNSVTHNFFPISWTSGSETPHFLAAVSTVDGGDSAHLRYQNLSTSGVEVRIEEDTTVDPEVFHTTEIVSYLMLLGESGILFATPSPH